MSRIFFDTNMFIAIFEDEGDAGMRVGRLVERMFARGDVLLTSAMTLGELLVRPAKEGREDLAARYRSSLCGPGITLIPFDARAAQTFAELRSRGIKPPDAIQLACAATHGCDLFVSNDRALSGLDVPGIQFIATLDTVPI